MQEIAKGVATGKGPVQDAIREVSQGMEQAIQSDEKIREKEKRKEKKEKKES